MPSRAQRERSDRRRALRYLAGAPEGVTEALMLVHGFPVPLLVDLCIAGLAIARHIASRNTNAHVPPVFLGEDFSRVESISRC
jgi:hypothetical protein